MATLIMGTLNVTRSVDPVTTVTPTAAVDPDGPAPALAGLNVTVTSAGRMLPPGNPCPITVTMVTPGSASLGTADGLSVTWVTAPHRCAPHSKANIAYRRFTARITACSTPSMRAPARGIKGY